MQLQAERDERVASAIAHWAPRFVTNGVDFGDFQRVTAGVTTWAEWLPAWVENGHRHAELVHHELGVAEAGQGPNPRDHRNLVLLSTGHELFEKIEIEDRLKRGELPAIVATSSLELGIDMGAVDLVVQIEAPPSVASGIQRIGRAGHSVGAVSRGVIFPKYRGDLLACAAAADAAGVERLWPDEWVGCA